MRLRASSLGLLVVLPLALAACAAKEEEAPPPPPDPMSQAGADAVRGSFINLYMSKNAAGVAEFYADDAVKYNADGSVANGKAAIMAVFESMIAAGQDSLGITSTGFQAEGDQAVDQGTWVMRALDKNKEASYQGGQYMMTFGRQADGGFKIVKDSVFNVQELETR